MHESHHYCVVYARRLRHSQISSGHRGGHFDTNSLTLQVVREVAPPIRYEYACRVREVLLQRLRDRHSDDLVAPLLNVLLAALLLAGLNHEGVVSRGEKGS